MSDRCFSADIVAVTKPNPTAPGVVVLGYRWEVYAKNGKVIAAQPTHSSWLEARGRFVRFQDLATECVWHGWTPLKWRQPKWVQPE